MAFVVADDNSVRQRIKMIELAKISTKLRRFLVDFVKIRAVAKPILADFKTRMRVVSRSSCMPAPVIPGKRLVSSNRAVLQLPDKAMYTDLSIHRLIPVIVVPVLSELSVIRTDIAFQIRIVRSGRMHHDAFDLNLPACLVAGVFCKNQFIEIHFPHPPSIMFPARFSGLSEWEAPSGPNFPRWKYLHSRDRKR